MNVLDVKIVKDFIRMCNDGWELGFHERNGGNLTYRLKDEERIQCEQHFTYDKEWVSMGVSDACLAHEYFLTTGSGKYFRNVILTPEEAIGIVEINERGDSYRIVWGLEGAKPTSEFPSHYLNHAVRFRATGGTSRVIYHAHPANTIAMTFTLPLTEKAITRALWQSATECVVVFPFGVGIVPWMIPGSSQIAVATSKVMEKYDSAIWAHHGIFCAGDDFDLTFGLMHTIEKAAEIYNIAMSSSGGNILQTITDQDLIDTANAFGVCINKDFLDI